MREHTAENGGEATGAVAVAYFAAAWLGKKVKLDAFRGVASPADSKPLLLFDWSFERASDHFGVGLAQHFGIVL